MTRIARTPAGLWVAGLVWMIELVRLLFVGHLPLPLLQAGSTLLVAALLVFGSRIGWVLALFGTVGDAVARLGGEEPSWILGLDGVVLVALILPASLRFVWTSRPPRRFFWPRALPTPPIDGIARLPYGLIAWRLGFALLVLLVLGGMVEIWTEESGRDSSAAGILVDVLDLLFSVALLVFIVSLCAWAYRSFGARLEASAPFPLAAAAAMVVPMTRPESAEESYDRFAAAYDEANAQNDYEMWVGEVLLPELEKRGLRKGWALDAGCGTGRAFEPLLERGWKVFGCDLSAEMLAEAERKFGSRVGLQKVDARELGSVRPPAELPGGKFDLVLLLNDVVNYLTEDGDLEKAFAGVRQNLNPDHGLVAFDVNTLSLFRDNFVSGTLERDAQGWEWQGLTDSDAPGTVFEARLSGDGIETHVHRQRHWTAEQVRSALEEAGLRFLAALGQREGEDRVVLSEPPDEERDHKIIYIASLA